MRLVRAASQPSLFDVPVGERRSSWAVRCLEAAFAHHVWATSRLIEPCLDLSVEELKNQVRNRHGSMSLTSGSAGVLAIQRRMSGGSVMIRWRVRRPIRLMAGLLST